MKVCVQFQNGEQQEFKNVYDLETRFGAIVIGFKVGKSFRKVFFDFENIKIISIIPN
jgi:hypothetical protein